MKILITGSTGFVGRNLTRFLSGFYTVQSLSIRYNSEIALPIGNEVVIHLAGKSHDLKEVSQPQEYYEANFELTKQLFDAFLISDVEIFIFMSTVKAVADTVDGILKEDLECKPKTHYGIAKHQAEQYILSHKLPADKRVYILRPCMIHGSGNKGNLNLLYKIVEKGLPWPLAAFENKRSFLGIDNLNYLIHQMLLKKDLESGIYNFADDQALSTNELISTINKALHKKAKLWNISKPLIEKTATLGDRLRLPLNSERLKKLTESYVVSNEKIKTALGIEKLPLSAEEGLIKTINSFKNTKS